MNKPDFILSPEIREFRTKREVDSILDDIKGVYSFYIAMLENYVIRHDLSWHYKHDLELLRRMLDDIKVKLMRTPSSKRKSQYLSALKVLYDIIQRTNFIEGRCSMRKIVANAVRSILEDTLFEKSKFLTKNLVIKVERLEFYDWISIHIVFSVRDIHISNLVSSIFKKRDEIRKLLLNIDYDIYEIKRDAERILEKKTLNNLYYEILKNELSDEQRKNIFLGVPHGSLHSFNSYAFRKYLNVTFYLSFSKDSIYYLIPEYIGSGILLRDTLQDIYERLEDDSIADFYEYFKERLYTRFCSSVNCDILSEIRKVLNLIDKTIREKIKEYVAKEVKELEKLKEEIIRTYHRELPQS